MSPHPILLINNSIILFFKINNIKFSLSLDLAFDRLVPQTEGWWVMSRDGKNVGKTLG